MRARANIAKNRLYLDFRGVVTKKKLETLYTDIRFTVADLSPGFDLISDYSECKLLQLDCLPVLKKIIGYLIENGLSEIVRIITDDHVSYKQVLNLNVRIQGYKPIYVASQDEVEEKLNAVIRRKGVRIHLHDVLVEYEVNSQNGSGRVVDISTSGCAIELSSDAKALNVNDEVELQISFGYRTEKPETFRIKSHTVRVERNLFAVEFTDFEDEKREHLWKRLLIETKS